MPVVRIPTVLRKHTAGEAKVEASGSTVGEVFHDLIASHPGLEENLFEDGKVRGFINVYVDDEDIRYVSGTDTPVADDGEIAIMPAVAGGAERSEHARHGRLAGGAERSEHARHGRLAGGAERSEHARHGRLAGGAVDPV
jgi:sulfur-carrier protein